GDCRSLSWGPWMGRTFRARPCYHISRCSGLGQQLHAGSKDTEATSRSPRCTSRGKTRVPVGTKEDSDLRAHRHFKTERRGFRRHFSARPSLSERIHNLELFNEG